ncbi:MAG: DUF1064 domain-containing protein [Eubacteriales bacterium]|nr:DUF1064 domain-containing protein [Eubacteriales bacterium]
MWSRSNNKFHAQKVFVDGEHFDSLREYRRWEELKLLEKAGEITDLERQVNFELIPKQIDPNTGKVKERACSYKADFVYTEDGQRIVEDSKGFKTPEYRIKKKLLLWRYGISIKET